MAIYDWMDPAVYVEARDLQMKAITLPREWGVPDPFRLLELMIPSFTWHTWSDAELDVYRAITGPHGCTIFKAMLIKHNLDPKANYGPVSDKLDYKMWTP